MIPCSEEKGQPARWQSLLSDQITCPKKLAALCPGLVDELQALQAANTLFAIKIPRHYLHYCLSRPNPAPLLRQFLPTVNELRLSSGFSDDPLSEQQFNPLPGLLHKYHGRVLLTTTQACAVHCRYCFRRHFQYKENAPGKAGWQKIFARIAQDKSIHELILSGGDPLSLPNQYLAYLLELAEEIPQLKTIRFHSRFPVLIPERIDEGFINLLNKSRLRGVFVTHINHPDELWQPLQEKMAILKSIGITLLNQSVLLKGVNDCADTLIALSHQLFEAGILPYYLHLLDKVQGAQHFEVPQTQAKSVFKTLQAQLPGYLVPKFVFEQPGAANKVRAC